MTVHRALVLASHKKGKNTSCCVVFGSVHLVDCWSWEVDSASPEISQPEIKLSKWLQFTFYFPHIILRGPKPITKPNIGIENEKYKNKRLLAQAQFNRPP